MYTYVQRLRVALECRTAREELQRLVSSAGTDPAGWLCTGRPTLPALHRLVSSAGADPVCWLMYRVAYSAGAAPAAVIGWR